MLSIRDIIKSLNDTLCNVLPSGSKLYNVAYTAVRGQETLPVIDENYVGIDNTYPVQIYHKINSVSISQKNSYGDNPFNYINTYQCSIVVFNNQKQTKLNPDELALIIQTGFPKILESKNFTSVRPLLTGVILNSQQVFSQEYKSDKFRLSETESLFLINYSLEVAYGCLDLCPEDFLTHKN